MNLQARIMNVRDRKLVVATILRWLSHAGIKIVPYNLYAESNDYMEKANFTERFSKVCTVKRMSHNDLDTIIAQENMPELKKMFLTLWDQGSFCLYVTREDRMIAYAWCDLSHCQYDHLLFKLEDDEAYAFNFWTSKRARWVATFLAGSVQAHLRNLGRDKIYSVTEVFNTPAINLRKKLRSKLCRRFVYLKLLALPGINIELNI